MYKLTIEGLHKSYGEHEVLKGVSLKANTGDVISLIGASGSGKSTFLRCINFLEQPNDGAMSLDGQNIRMIKDRHGMHVADADELQRIRPRLAFARRRFDLVLVVFGLDVDGTRPVFRRFRDSDLVVEPVLELDLLDGAVEVLDLDRAIVRIDCDDFESLAAGPTVPIADDRCGVRHLQFPFAGSNALLCSLPESLTGCCYL